MDKFVLKPCSGEIHSYMDGDRVFRMVKDDWKESAGRNINSSDKLVKIPLPEDEDTTMSMPCREGKFWVQSVSSEFKVEQYFDWKKLVASGRSDWKSQGSLMKMKSRSCSLEMLRRSCDTRLKPSQFQLKQENVVC